MRSAISIRPELGARVAAWIFAAAGVLVLPQSGLAQTPQEIARQVFKSIVLVSTNDGSGQPMSLGSGFILKEGVIATNLHVVEGAAGGYAKPIEEATRHEIVGTLAVDEACDLILLKVDGLRGSPLRVDENDASAVGDTVYAVGNPRGLEGTFSQGIVSGIRTVGSDTVLQITAPISPGSSGGPVLNTRGEVIGVSVAAFRDGQNLNFAIPARYLRRLAAAPENLSSLGAHRANNSAKSIVSLLGDEAPPVVGSHFLWGESAFVEWYTFGIRNNLRQPICSVDALVVFLDKDKIPVASASVAVAGPVPPMLAGRSTPQATTSDVRQLCDSVEIRIIGFEVVEETTAGPRPPQRYVLRGLVFEASGDWIRDKYERVLFEELKLRLPRVPGETKDYDVGIYHFGDSKQNAEGDMKAWAKAFALDPARVAPEVTHSGDLKITVFELSGQFTAYTEGAIPISNYRMLGAVVEGTGGPWFVRAIGPNPVISRAHGDFIRLVRSIRRE